jgi:hypothetical protein
MTEPVVYSKRNATAADIPAVLEVEKSWPEESRAGADKFRSRLARFPEGFFLATIRDESGREVVVGTVTSMPLRYDAAHLENFRSWDTVTNHGYLPEVIDRSACNALYVVSGVIDQRHRYLNLFPVGILQEAELATSMGYRYVVGGAVLPGYRRHCERHGPTEAWDYVTLRRGGHLADPLLALYESIRFHVPDRRHVIPEYFPDEPSMNHAALVVRDLERDPL